VRPN
jgi:hypothetical protein